VASLLSERAVGRTLSEVRDALQRGDVALRHQVDGCAGRSSSTRAVAPRTRTSTSWSPRGLRCSTSPVHPRRIREIFEAPEMKERLAEIVEGAGDGRGRPSGAGREMGDPALSHCALVATRYGDEVAPLGAVGVIGPSRMDYSRVIPLVAFCSRAITHKLSA
jgi:transcriptional regulator of heat shock response